MRTLTLAPPPWGWLAVSVETGYAIGSEAGSNKVVVIPASGGTGGFQGLLSLILV